LLACRALVGIGEGVTPPAATALIAQWFGPRDRARAMGIAGFAQNMGAVGGLILAPSIIDAWGWPWVFTSFGGLGLVWAAAWAALAKEPKESGASAQPSQKAGEDDRPGILGALFGIPWLAFLRQPSVWAIVIVHFCYNYGFYTLLAWTPTYLSSALGYDLKMAATLSILPYVCVALASYAAGSFADSLIGDPETGGMSTTDVRRVMQTSALVGASFFFALLGLEIVPPGSPEACVACLAAAFVFAAGSFGGLFCSWADLSPKYAGPLNGLSSTAGALGGVLGNYLAGQILDETGSWGQAVFFPTVACFLTGAVCWCTLYQADEIDFDKADDTGPSL